MITEREGPGAGYAPRMAGRDTDWEGVRLHVVTGKGGTGKTTVAAALALALATDGRRTLLVEVEGRQGIAQLFDVPPLPYGERRVAVGRGGSGDLGGSGGTVSALAVDPEEALLEYLDMFYKLGRAGRALRRMGAIDFATTIAPGMRDVLLTGKVYEAVRRRKGGAHIYDAVVLDGPPTGRITRFLAVNPDHPRPLPGGWSTGPNNKAGKPRPITAGTMLLDVGTRGQVSGQIDLHSQPASGDDLLYSGGIQGEK